MFFQEWLDIVMFKKKPEDVVKSNPSIMDGLKHYVIATVLVLLVTVGLSAVTTGLFDITITLGITVGGVVIGIIVLLITYGIFHLIAKLLGGKGDYQKLVGAGATIAAAVNGTIGLLLAIIGAFVPAIGLLGFIVALYALFLFLSVAAAVYGFSIVKALITLIVTLVVLAIIGFIIALVVGAALIATLFGSSGLDPTMLQ